MKNMYLRVDSEIQSHEFDELWVCESHHLAEVPRPVFARVNGTHAASILVQIAVDDGGYGRQFGYHFHGVFVHILNQKDSTKI